MWKKKILSLDVYFSFIFINQQDNDKIVGGLTLDRYKDLYGEFLGNTDRNPGCFLFGPLAADE